MPITIDTMNEIFSASQNDMKMIVATAKEEFYRPEIDRETVSMWLELPLMMREAITAKNPKLAKDMDARAEKLRKGEMNYASSSS
jgi:hypothetical protein